MLSPPCFPPRGLPPTQLARVTGGTGGAQRTPVARSRPKRYRDCHRTGEAERSGIEYSAGAPGLLQNLDSSVRFRPAPLAFRTTPDPAEPLFEPRMRNRDATAVVAYPTQSMIIASVATTQNLIVISYGDGRKEHGTYPPNGRFHVTFEGERDSRHSFVTPGPVYSELTYYPLARVDVPPDPPGLTRPYGGSGQTMTIEPRGTLEIRS